MISNLDGFRNLEVGAYRPINEFSELLIACECFQKKLRMFSFRATSPQTSRYTYLDEGQQKKDGVEEGKKKDGGGGKDGV
jgi:hypothetical protein